MEIFNFLWLIWDHYLPHRTIDPLDPHSYPPGWGSNLGALHKINSAPKLYEEILHLDCQLNRCETYWLPYKCANFKEHSVAHCAK